MAVIREPGLVAGVNFNRQMKGFDVGASFGYAQNVQTVLATQVTSDYSYLANARRKLTRRLLWNANFHGFHTGLGQLPGYGSHSEGFGTNLTYKSYGLERQLRQAPTDGAAYRERTGDSAGNDCSGASGNQYLLEHWHILSFTGTANPMKQWR